jgi:hypothetical protein
MNGSSTITYTTTEQAITGSFIVYF